jgi:hypothetical protein
VVVEDLGVEPEVGGDQGPGDEEGDQSEESATGFVAALAADFDYVDGTGICQKGRKDKETGRGLRLNSVEDEDATTLHHVPFIEREVVDVGRDESIMGNTGCLEHALLPEAGSTLDSCECVDQGQDDDAFDGTRYEAERESLGVVFIPGLYVEGQGGWSFS